MALAQSEVLHQWSTPDHDTLERYGNTPPIVSRHFQNYRLLLVGSRTYSAHLHDMHLSFLSRCFCRSIGSRAVGTPPTQGGLAGADLKRTQILPQRQLFAELKRFAGLLLWRQGFLGRRRQQKSQIRVHPLKSVSPSALPCLPFQDVCRNSHSLSFILFKIITCMKYVFGDVDEGITVWFPRVLEVNCFITVTLWVSCFKPTRQTHE